MNVTIQDSSGMASDLSLSFRVKDTNLTVNINSTANGTALTNQTLAIQDCDEETDEDCEKEWFEIECPECEEDYEEGP